MTLGTKEIARWALALGALVGSHAVASATQPVADKYVVKAGTVLTMGGKEIKNGIILMEGGRITAVGTEEEVEVPWDAEVLDASELVAFPGFVEAHSSSGMDRANENLDVTPFLNVRDSIDPVNFYFQDCLRAGVTTINVQQGNSCVVGGQGMIVKPYGMTVEQMAVRPGSGLKMSIAPKRGKSHATQLQVLRGAFQELKTHLEDLVQQKKDGDDRARREALYQGRDLEGEGGKGREMKGSAWTVEGLESVPRGEIDEKLEPLLHVVEGRLPVFMYCGSARDVGPAVEVAEENGFLGRTTFVLAAGCWKAADEIAAAGRPVVLAGSLTHVELDPVTGEEKETFVPSIYAEKGVNFALSSLNATTLSLWYQAALCVANGVEREMALGAVTTTPASMLGLEKRTGQIAKGFDANIVLFSGDPLSLTSSVEFVVLDGDLVYDRSTDVRQQHLLEGIAPENTAPAIGAVDGPVDVHAKEIEEGQGADDQGDDEEEEGEQ